ncbi:MAG: class A beta-lactamase-related serine hydrolase [Thermomicrobiales bacterium]|nr:MAG: class A beta-lactamase-related serine hydrolase [Thermomicrobiales bacterium]
MTHDFSKVEEFIDRIVDEQQVNGAGIAIAVKGEPVFERFAGEAAPGTPATGETLWPLASISKSFTASAVMSLIEEGRLGMWSRPNAIFPEFQGDGREEITLRHLLTHTSGLPMGPANIAELEEAGASAEELIAHAYTDPLLFPPGTGQSYSDTGYGLAGLMAARVAGVSFPELIRTRVLEPAGLTGAGLCIPDALMPRVAQVAGPDGEAIDWGARTGHPSYGVAATLSSVLRFLLHFDPNTELRLHSRAGVRAMSTDQTAVFRSDAVDFPIGKWGAGFQLQTGWGDTGLGAIDSFGHMGGTGCVGWISPADAVSVAFVSNRYWSGDPASRERREAAVNLAIAAATAPVAGGRRVGFGR